MTTSDAASDGNFVNMTLHFQSIHLYSKLRIVYVPASINYGIIFEVYKMCSRLVCYCILYPYIRAFWDCIGICPKTHLKLKYHEIACFHNTHFSCRIVLTICTQHGSDIAVPCSVRNFKKIRHQRNTLWTKLKKIWVQGAFRTLPYIVKKTSLCCVLLTYVPTQSMTIWTAQRAILACIEVILFLLYICSITKALQHGLYCISAACLLHIDELV